MTQPGRGDLGMGGKLSYGVMSGGQREHDIGLG